MKPDRAPAPGAVQVPAGTPWPAVACSDWGEPFDAFPVEVPFQVRPDLVKLAPADDWLRVDRQWASMLGAKLAARTGDAREPPAGNVAVASACDRHAARARLAAVSRAVSALAATAAGRRLGLQCAGGRLCFGAAGYRAELADGRVALHADRADAAAVVRTLESGDGASRLLGALAMSLQEDLVLMEQGADGRVRAAILQVSFPSAWNPADKVGEDLLALHAPVADNGPLQAAAARLGNALIAKGPFVRWVWTVTADDRWRAWPPLPTPPEPAQAQAQAAAAAGAAKALHFRLERQSTMPLGEGYGLFLIRVQVKPLDEALAQPGRLGLLQDSLRSMSDAMVRYKNLAVVRDRILET